MSAMRARAPAIVVRIAREDDLDAVAAIERSVFNDPWSRRAFAELVHASHVVFLVASTGSSVVGYVVVLLAAQESELANLAIARLVQRQGLGRRLLAEAVDGARARGATEMFLEVRASNTAAARLYEGAGFAAVGRRVKYYARPVEDAVVMRVALDGSARPSSRAGGGGS